MMEIFGALKCGFLFGGKKTRARAEKSVHVLEDSLQQDGLVLKVLNAHGHEM